MRDFEEAHYFHTIEDFSDLITHYGARQVLEDLRILSLTNYENLAKIVVRTEENQKRTAALLKPNANKN